MPQVHRQHGVFHVITNTRGKIPWCTYKGIPQLLIDNLVMTRNMMKAELYAFCILPDHMHILLNPGEKGLGKFMQSFKSHSAQEAKLIFPATSRRSASVASSHGSTLREGNYFVGAWQRGYFDERIRDARQRSAAFHYIQGNAMKHELVPDISDWPWTSLHFQGLLDPMDIWL